MRSVVARRFSEASGARHVLDGWQADPRGEPGPNGRSSRVYSNYTAVVANARSCLRSACSKPVNRKRLAYVTYPMGTTRAHERLSAPGRDAAR